MNKIKNINRLFLGMVIFAFLFSYGIGFFVTGLGTEMAMILGQLMYLIPILFYIVVMRVPVKEEIPFRKIKWSTACMVVLFVILLMPLVSFLNLFSMLFVTNHVNASAQELNTNPFFGESASGWCNAGSFRRIYVPRGILWQLPKEESCTGSSYVRIDLWYGTFKCESVSICVRSRICILPSYGGYRKHTGAYAGAFYY